VESDVRRYLDAHPAHHETFEHWDIQGKLRVRLSLAGELPPASVSSSVLAIVFNRDRQVLFLHPSDPSGSIAHLVAGGRPEDGETPEETAIREVAEETGWRVRPIKMIGFRHFFHTEPRSPRTDRPYPDFIQPIYVAVAETFDPRAIIADDKLEADFLDYAVAEDRIELGQRPLLWAAETIVVRSI
jgi:8-oxo-dGTP pyrophosphatase MutT (NUDIX family)